MPYIGNSPGTGTRNRFIFTATASQTTFSGTDDNGKTLAYSDGDYVDVYLNGICLVPVDDYAATSKTSIVLTVGAAASDTLEVVAYDIATIADTVSKANGGQFDGDITVNASFTVDNGSIKLDGNYPTGTGNVALGDAALDDASLTGSYNTAIGSSALTANTTATYNTAVGYISLLANTTGQYNTAVGAATMEANTTGNENAALGLGALNRNTSGSYNTALGRSSLEFNTTAYYNTAVGVQAGYSKTTAPESTMVGYQAGFNETTGGYNAFFGVKAGYAVTTGNENTFVGRFSGSDVTTGSRNTIVGKFDGNANGLDIRTVNDNVILSDGSQNMRFVAQGSSVLDLGGTPHRGLSNSLFKILNRGTGNTTETFTSVNMGMNDNITALINISVGGNSGSNQYGGCLIYWYMPRGGNSVIHQTIVPAFKGSAVSTFSVSASGNSLVVTKDSGLTVSVTIIGGGGLAAY